MDKNEYISKTEEFINKNDITKLKKDPTEQYNKELKQALNNTQFILTKNEKYRLINMNPKAPIMKALPKIHKENIPIRPIINCRNAPTYNTSKFLHKHITSHYKFKHNRSIKNTNEIIKNLENTTLNSNARLISFDLENMYTSIPTRQTIQIIEDNLTENSTLSHIEIQETIILLSLTLKQNYFKFNDNFYSQQNGLGMGSPLSGLLADIFVNSIENTLFSTDNSNQNITFWNRYVDDTFAIIDSTKTNMEQTLNTLNNLHPKLKFTAEEENNNKLHFLDLTIERHTNHLTYTIFRKPTQTSHTINNMSNHPGSHKRAAFQSMINRALNTPLSATNFNTEVNTIKNIAQENNYSTDLIDSILRRTQRKRNTGTHSTETEQTSKYALFTYINKDIYKVTNIFKRHNIKIAFKTDNKISNHIINNTIDTTDPLTEPGVYKLTCQEQNCTSTYIGQSGRNFQQRYKEHYKALAWNKYSAFAEHMYNENHSFTSINQDLQILHKQKKGRALNYYEQLEIQIEKSKNTENLNEHSTQPNSILNTIFTTPR